MSNCVAVHTMYQSEHRVYRIVMLCTGCLRMNADCTELWCSRGSKDYVEM